MTSKIEFRSSTNIEIKLSSLKYVRGIELYSTFAKYILTPKAPIHKQHMLIKYAVDLI